jgi:hypothetical protein
MSEYLHGCSAVTRVIHEERSFCDACDAGDVCDASAAWAAQDPPLTRRGADRRRKRNDKWQTLSKFTASGEMSFTLHFASRTKD